MTDSHIVSLAQIKEFIKVDSAIKFEAVSNQEKYDWINDTLNKFSYFKSKKKERGIVRQYIMKMTGLSKSQLTELIARKKKFGKIFLKTETRHCFPRLYGPTDIALLVETDNSHQRLSGQAAKTIMQREHGIFGKKEYERISNISVSHIYNLRETRQYKSHSLTVKKTIPVKNSIGIRTKPDPQGRPGHVRIDTVHQGDRDKEKGVYHINMVDEVLQWEIVGCIERISEYYLKPLLEDLLEQFPYVIVSFHSDNGSEYINKVIADLLNKLLIQQTKSRARHCNDNALVETKNGAVVRKYMGYGHIPKRFAKAVNQFYKEYFNIYLNFHRPCGFPTVIRDKKGKEGKVYRQEDYKTPYDKLKSLENADQYLEQGISFESLNKIAYNESDNEFAQRMQKQKEELSKNFKHLPQEMIRFTTFISDRFGD